LPSTVAKKSEKTVKKQTVAKSTRKLDREDSERRLIAAFDKVWTRDGIQGLGVNAVLKEAGVGKALLYRYFGDFVGLARAWSKGETFLPRPVDARSSAGGAAGKATASPDAEAATDANSATERHVSSVMAYVGALRARPKTRELLIYELLGSSPLTEALDEMRQQFGREMRAFVMASGATEGEDAYALSFFITAAMTYLAMRADTQPEYYGLRLDKPQDWQRVEAMLRRIAGQVLGATSSPSGDARPPRRP
jgi:AcrR family transcriptional regulator